MFHLAAVAPDFQMCALRCAGREIYESYCPLKSIAITSLYQIGEETQLNYSMTTSGI
jgi:hypothetical protein